MFDTQSRLSPTEFIKALNSYLPEDIAVRDAYEATESFDPRRDAVSREYRYTILNAWTRSPLNRDQSYLVFRKLELNYMQKAVKILKGEHDFASFTNQEGNLKKNTVRRIYEAEVSRNSQFIYFDVKANAFLPQQVRRMVAGLIKVGTGKLQISEFEDFLLSSVPGKASEVAPPNGLCLMKVNYS